MNLLHDDLQIDIENTDNDQRNCAKTWISTQSQVNICGTEMNQAFIAISI